MRIKIPLYLLTICTLSSCSKPNETHQKLKGNWHSGILELVNNPSSDSLDIEYNYSEYFFDENYMYSYSNSLNDFYSVEYFLRNDSLFYYVSNRRELFTGVINYPNDSTQLMRSEIDSTALYKIQPNNKTLNNFINPDKESFKTFIDKEIYLKHFKERYQQSLKQHLNSKD